MNNVLFIDPGQLTTELARKPCSLLLMTWVAIAKHGRRSGLFGVVLNPYQLVSGISVSGHARRSPTAFWCVIVKISRQTNASAKVGVFSRCALSTIRMNADVTLSAGGGGGAVNITMKLTFDGLVRALRFRQIAVREDITTGQLIARRDTQKSSGEQDEERRGSIAEGTL